MKRLDILFFLLLAYSCYQRQRLTDELRQARHEQTISQRAAEELWATIHRAQ